MVGRGEKGRRMRRESVGRRGHLKEEGGNMICEIHDCVKIKDWEYRKGGGAIIIYMHHDNAGRVISGEGGGKRCLGADPIARGSPLPPNSELPIKAG